jgi:amino acid transporter
MLLTCLTQFYTAIIAGPDVKGMGTAESFFKQFLAAPVVLAFWIIGWLWKREPFLRTKDIDVDTGLREIDWEEVRRHREEVAAMPAWRRLIHAMF